MAVSSLAPPRRTPPKTEPSKLKVRAMCNSIDQYFEYIHNQSPVKLRRFRSIEPQSKGRLGGWKTYERLQSASGAVSFEEEAFWGNEIRMKFEEEFEELSGGSEEDSDEEEDEEEEQQPQQQQQKREVKGENKKA
ncbi:uncharacterized protein H6S33_011606 [Morchella sextelata]|jgi:hypothetical protein|uniref:uncharacterized protein n=1 Tax=Morchella sextelata TaxID=1174677 RepID=UPI001D04B727|nr:uncharacterized protein H6S33_011606 [Morchella sextelata]KAH0611179.1 hypothetical protein H6S33_011606 [Morchella sextelata]